jgi:uncharacterized Zn-finger protein
MLKNLPKFEQVLVSSKEVVCDGGGGATGHPKVYLQIDQDTGMVICPYCSKTYILDKNAKRKAGH